MNTETTTKVGDRVRTRRLKQMGTIQKIYDGPNGITLVVLWDYERRIAHCLEADVDVIAYEPTLRLHQS